MIRKFYVEAYDIEDKPILGNIDGQSIIYACNYRRTNQFKGLKNLLNVTPKVSYYLIKDAQSLKVLERVERNVSK